MYAVTSGSMTPEYPRGSVVVVVPTQPEEIQIGDDITFQGPVADTLVTHRVIDIDTENRVFYTQGTNNSVPDSSPPPFETLIGKVEYSIPYVGHLVELLKTTTGKILAGCLLIVILLLLLIPELVSPPKEKSEKKQKKDKKEPPSPRETLEPRGELEEPEKVIPLPLPIEEIPQPQKEEASPSIGLPPQREEKVRREVPVYDDPSPFEGFPPFLKESEIPYDDE